MAAASTTDYTTTVLEALETMRLGELALGGPQARFKASAYTKAMNSIRRRAAPLTCAEDVRDLEGVGPKIYAKIQEIVSTGRLRAADAMRSAAAVDLVNLFLGIHGVGPVKARELMEAGFTSIAELRAAAPSVLNATQRLGLKYYEAGLQRIPRAEMTAHEARLETYVPTALLGVLVGSYRRGAATSGDIDMLLCPREGVSEAVAKRQFALFTQTLESSGYAVDVLARGEKKWMGYIVLEGGVARRLDLLLTPVAEFPFALLYFTGSDRFNVAFRAHCAARGYTLNEHRIAAVQHGIASVPPSFRSEEDIFTFVGLRYVPPTERVDDAQIIAVDHSKRRLPSTTVLV